MNDPLMQPIIEGADARMNDMVSGFNGLANLGVGMAMAAVGAGAALGVAAAGGAISRSVPYDSNHMVSREPSVEPAHEMRISRSDNSTLTADVVASDPVIGSMGLPQRALEALAAVTQQHGRAFGGVEASEKNLGEVVPTALRDGAAEQLVRVHDSGLAAA